MRDSRVCGDDPAHRRDRDGGQALLPQLLERGDEVRVLVRDPRKLGRQRVEVQIALGDLTELARSARSRARRCAASTP